MLAEKIQHRAQVLQVQQQQALFVGNPERDIQHAFLDIVQIHQPRQQQRAHFRNGGADRVALFAEQVPEHRREAIRRIIIAQALGPRDERPFGFARRRDARQIAFHIRGEHRHPGFGKALGQHLQRDRFAGARGPRDQAVAIGQPQHQIFGLVPFSDQNSVTGISHVALPYRVNSRRQ